MKEANINVNLIDCMGNDLTVVNAARVSFAKTKYSFDEKDEKLIKYLAENNHWSPFSHVFITFKIKSPIFVARQLVKHQVGLSWNEESRRYIDTEPEFYFPDTWRTKSKDKKQGSNENETIDTLNNAHSNSIHDVTRNLVNSALTLYELMLSSGVAPEQARIILPQNMMVNWFWSGSFYAFIRVCNLRLNKHAQFETRQVAEKILYNLERIFPVCTKYLIKVDKEGEVL